MHASVRRAGSVTWGVRGPSAERTALRVRGGAVTGAVSLEQTREAEQHFVGCVRSSACINTHVCLNHGKNTPLWCTRLALGTHAGDMSMSMSQAMCDPVCGGELCAPPAHNMTPVDASTTLLEVPLTLHQTWKTCTLPSPQAAWHARCQRILSVHGWRIVVWDDVHLRKLVEQHYALFLPMYDQYKANIMRVDAARLFLLHRFGGLYMDLDFVCVRAPVPFPTGQVTLVANSRFQSSEEYVSNAWMAAPPGHPFMWRAINSLKRTAASSHPLRATGPIFLTGVYHGWNRDHDFNNLKHLRRSHAVGPYNSTIHMETVNLGSHSGVQRQHLMMRRSGVFPCGKHAREEEVVQCSQNSKYPNLTFVTYWTATWVVHHNKTAKTSNGSLALSTAGPQSRVRLSR